MEAWFVRPSFCHWMKGFVAERFLEAVGIFVVTWLNQTLGWPGSLPLEKEDLGNSTWAENLGWVVVEQKTLIELFTPRGKWLPIWLAHIVQTDGRKPPTLKSRFTRNVKKNESFPKVAQVVTWWFLACCWNLHPFFQNYKKSWPSLSTITKRIPRNWQTMNSSNSQKTSYNWIISLSTIHF